MHQKLLISVVSVLWVFSSTVHAEKESSTPTAADLELDEARALLEKFKAAVMSDADEAKKIHEDFMTKSDAVKRGYGRHLESEWIRLKGEISQTTSKSRASSSKGMSSDQKLKVKEMRELLVKIRALKDEGEMKKKLEQEGWAALEFLQTRYKGGDFEAPAEDEGKDSGGALDEKRNTAILIGNFRHELFKSFGVSKDKDPAAVLGIGKDDAAKENALNVSKMSAADRQVLEKNEKLAKEIKSEEAEGIRQLNEWRIALGLNALLIDPKLCDTGRDHSKDMAEQGFFAHESPVKGKKSPWDRAKNFGTKASSENIAINDGAKASNRAWFHSPGHHKNMFAEGRTHIGLGGHGRHWTQMFR